MNKDNFIHFIDDLSKFYPDSTNIVLMDNSATHFIESIPDNVKFIYTEPYNPELNPAERVWREFKDSMAWRNFTTIADLQLYISSVIELLNNFKIMSLTQYSYILDAYNALIK